MPPSTVFSYWRRDHRRAGAPLQPQQQEQQQGAQQQQQQPQQLTVSSSKANAIDAPPQLPFIPSTPDLTASFGESPDGGEGGGGGGGGGEWTSEETNTSPLQQQSHHWDHSQSQGDKSTNSRAPTSSSATNLTVPSSLEKQARPHSSPEEREKLSPSPPGTSQSNYSQSSFAAGPRPDLSEADSTSSRQDSPFRLSFGKGITPSSTEGQKPPSTTATSAHSAPSVQPPPKPTTTTTNNNTTSSNNSKTSPDVSPAEKPTVPPKDGKLDRSGSRRLADRESTAEHPHHKSGKTMLHLLNPMSLLARRRSSRIPGSRADDVKIGPASLVPAIPDDYDPRIRGNIVHDFSAPRPRRNAPTATAPSPQDGTGQTGSNEAPQNAPATASTNQSSEQQKTWHSEHPPAFKEHFEDDQRALQVENKGYLQSPLLLNQPDSEHSLPAFARKLPSKVPEVDEEQSEELQSPSQPQQPPQQKQEEENQGQDQEHQNQSRPQQLQPQEEKEQEQTAVEPETSLDSAKKGEPPRAQDDEDPVVKMPLPPSGLPRHLKSNASRFSFDMTDMESSVQEKLLEEKHKEKEAERRAKYGPDDYSDEDNYDDLLDDMDDGLEEKIPGVNTDADDDDFDGFSGPPNIISKSWFSPGLSPIIGSPASPAVPTMANVAPKGPGVNPLAQHPPPVQNSYFPLVTENGSPGDNTTDAPPQPGPSADVVGAPPGPSQQPQPDDDDDLYFDDGEFGDLSVDTGGEEKKFDESIFDDENSHLYDRKKKQPAEPEPGASTENKDQQEADNSRSSSEDETLVSTNPSSRQVDLGHAPSMASEYRGTGLKNYNSVSERARDPRSAKAHGGVLSEHNLEALHNALTNAAAGKDRFEANESISDRSLDQESAVARTAQTSDSHPGLVSDNSRLSQAMDAFGSEEVFEDFDYDDTGDYDDPIIAAANAEALENDDEGFYGEEFGFYAYSQGTNDTQAANGGWFDGISRSFSSRGKFREPSLTPITERSERSTRNSVISMTAPHGPSSAAAGQQQQQQQQHTSPALAQLVDLSGNFDEEMSLSALMKLRRGAWGGSNSSLRSSSASPPPAAAAPHPHSASSNRGSFTALSDASPTMATIPADLIWPGTNGSVAGSPIREPERNASSTASPI